MIFSTARKKGLHDYQYELSSVISEKDRMAVDEYLSFFDTSEKTLAKVPGISVYSLPMETLEKGMGFPLPGDQRVIYIGIARLCNYLLIYMTSR